MAVTPSAMPALGTQAPDFTLADVVTGRNVSRDSVAGKKGLLVMFLSRHCPFVQHVQQELAKIGRDYQASGIGIVAICSNDVVTHPDDAPANLASQSRELGFSFPYLHDETQDVARSYDAQCTPDFFLYDSRLRLAYRGQLDDSRPKSDTPVTGRDLRAAMDALAAGGPVSPDQRPSIGCNIKWKQTIGDRG